jgi:hypothetical protein
MVKSFTVTSSITPQEAVINTDLIAIFTPFIEGVLPTTKDETNSLYFENIGDVTVGGDSVEQQELDLNSVVAYSINTKKTQGDVSFSVPVDPDAGPPTLPELTAVIASSPQGVLWIGKLKSTSGDTKTYAKWGEIPVNFDHANDISWPKNNAQSANAVFHTTGKGKKLGFATQESETIIVTSTP